MNRMGKLATATLSLTFSGLTWLSSPMPAQATTITDTFQLKAQGKTWCRDNPRFFEAFNVKAKHGDTVTIMRDPLNIGDLTNIQTTVNTQGARSDIDAITLNGLAFPSNKAGRTAQLVLLGTLNNGHFLTIRGMATFDKHGNLTGVTGTFWDQVTATYTIDKHGTQSGPVDCFDTGTLGTGKKL